MVDFEFASVVASVLDSAKGLFANFVKISLKILNRMRLSLICRTRTTFLTY